MQYVCVSVWVSTHLCSVYVYLSGCPPICPSSHIAPWWIVSIFGTMIRYHRLLMHIKIECGSSPNFRNYGKCFIHFEYWLWYVRDEYCFCYTLIRHHALLMLYLRKEGFILFIFHDLVQQSTIVTDACNIYLGSVSKCLLFVCSDIFEMNQWILFILDTVIVDACNIRLWHNCCVF